MNCMVQYYSYHQCSEVIHVLHLFELAHLPDRGVVHQVVHCRCIAGLSVSFVLPSRGKQPAPTARCVWKQSLEGGAEDAINQTDKPRNRSCQTYADRSSGSCRRRTSRSLQAWRRRAARRGRLASRAPATCRRPRGGSPPSSPPAPGRPSFF